MKSKIEIKKMFDYGRALDLSTIKASDLQLVVDTFGLKKPKVKLIHNCRDTGNDTISFDTSAGEFTCNIEELLPVIYPNVSVDLIQEVSDNYLDLPGGEEVYNYFIKGITVNPYNSDNVKLWLNIV